MNPFYVSIPVLASFEGEQGGQPAGQPNPDPTPQASGEKKFSQEDLNSYLAQDRRKHQVQLQKMEQNLSALADSKTLSDEDRARTEANLEEVRTALLTTEQRATKEKKALEEAAERRLKAKDEETRRWENLYKESLVEQSLRDAATHHEAFSSDQIVTQLRHMTRTEEKLDANGKPTGKYKPVVDFPEKAESGETTVTPLSPDAAVKKMKAMPQVYGNLFRGNVVSGIGSGSGAGAPAGTGKIDPRKLSMQQYLEIREKNPGLLGLRPPKNNGRRL
jgi:hypothetical protein